VENYSSMWIGILRCMFPRWRHCNRANRMTVPSQVGTLQWSWLVLLTTEQNHSRQFWRTIDRDLFASAHIIPSCNIGAVWIGSKVCQGESCETSEKDTIDWYELLFCLLLCWDKSVCNGEEVQTIQTRCEQLSNGIAQRSEEGEYTMPSF
jgi:hypothetical protein